MAHSLFEPAPTPLSEKLWRRVKDLNIGLPARHTVDRRPAAEHTDPTLLQQAEMLDARGRQQLLQAVLTSKPMAKQKPRASKAHGSVWLKFEHSI